MDLDFLIRSYKKGATFKHVNHDMEIFSTDGVTNTPLRKKKQELIYLARKNGACIIRAYAFYLSMKIVDIGKRLLDNFNPELKKKIRMRQI